MGDIIKRRIVNELEDLVFKRTNVEQLNKTVQNIIGCKINFEDVTEQKDDDDTTDYNLLSGFEDFKELYGYIDIYYLKMRCESFEGANIIVTGVSVEFE